MSDLSNTKQTHEIYDVLIIGAGVSGLTLAHQLKVQQKKIMIIEKSKGIGGRIATRRAGDFTFDHGAQFLKFSTQSGDRNFIGLADKVLPLASLEKWFESSDSIYFAKAKGLTQFAKSFHLAEQIVFEQKVIHLKPMSDQGWEVQAESGQKWLARTVVLSAPLPQSLELLKQSQIKYPKELNLIHYACACVGLFGFSESVPLIDREETGQKSQTMYMQELSSSIFSVSNQMSKGVSKVPAFTVVMQPQFSQSEWAKPDQEILENIEYELKQQNKINIRFDKCEFRQLKKWKYSHPTSQYKSLHVSLNKDSLFIMGDAFGGGSVPGAIRSSISLFEYF